MMTYPSFQKSPQSALTAGVAGALFTLSFAPFHWWPIAIFSIAILLLTLQKATPKQALLRGWSFGFGFYLCAVSWVYVSIHQFGSASPVLAIFLTVLFAAGLALFFALHAFIFSLFYGEYKQKKHNSALTTLLVFPALWVIAEWFRSWFLTGFPWLLAGYAPLDTWLAGWAPVTGIYGLSFYTVLAATCLVLVIQTNKWQTRTRILLFFIALLPFACGLVLTQQSFTSPKGQPIETVLVQGNTPQQLKWKPESRQRIYDNHLALTLEHIESPLIIWPETAIPHLLQNAQPMINQLDNFLLKNRSALITGIPSVQFDGERKRYYNSVVGLGNAAGIYHKQRLVPFGEYVPLESALRGLIDFFNLPMSSFSLGPAEQAPILLNRGTAGNISISPYICYEIVYPDLVAQETGNIILTVSNDSWFGDSLAPHQHLQMARMRALETGRFVIRATNNGISATIDAKGNITQRSPQFVTATLTAAVQPMEGKTPFAKTGSLPIIVVSFLLLLIGVILVSKNKAMRAYD